MKRKDGNSRVTGKEQYYTPATVARDVLVRAASHIKDPEGRVFLEPAGGTGVFLEAAKEFGFSRRVSYDIEPHHPGVNQGSFLDQSLSLLTGAVCVSNPPFGRNNALSIPFFNHAADHCDLIAFIVPRSWRKWSVINRLDTRFRLVDDWDLQIDYQDRTGVDLLEAGKLRTCVQVWRREETLRRKIVKVPDHGIVSKTTPEDADVSLTLFGYGCGTVKEDFPRVCNSTQAFLKLHHPRALEALRSVDFSRFYRHTAYIEALGMSEINFLLNEFLGLEATACSLDPVSGDYLGLSYDIEKNLS